jgi:chitinase
MNYDMEHPGSGNSESWFNSPLYSVAGQYLWSADYMIKSALNCGIAGSKLSIGMAFYAGIYTTDNGPYQSESGIVSYNQQGYGAFVGAHNVSGATYDTTAHVPWIALSGSSYASWDNAQSVTDKENYVTANGLGGWMIWVLGWDYTGGSPAYPLLNAIGQAFSPEPPTGIKLTVN